MRRSRLFYAINEILGRPVGDSAPVTDLAAEEIAEARDSTLGVLDNASSSDLGEIGSFSKAVVPTNRPLNILVVEDNAVNQVVIDELLRDFGHTTVLAENGEQAIERVKKDNIDLV